MQDYFSEDAHNKILLSKYYDDGVGPKLIKAAFRWAPSIKEADMSHLEERFYLHGLWAVPRRVLTVEDVRKNDTTLSGDEDNISRVCNLTSSLLHINCFSLYTDTLNIHSL